MVQNKQQKQRKQQNTASITNRMDLFEGTGKSVAPQRPKDQCPVYNINI